jgi:glycosyltransferase involved in cell wall biosynthesis
MKIIFDLRRVGLGNNGGSSTLIKSGNALVELGHDVFFIDGGKNQHTWTPLKAEHIRANNDRKIPDADVIIATGYKSVGPTCKAPKRCGKKYHYIRGWETWQMRESAIVENILKAPTTKIVNGVGLQEKLKKFGFDSYIIRPGYDFDELYPKNIRENKKDVVLGGIYLSGARGSRKRTQWLFAVARNLKTKYRNVKFWLFGNEESPQDGLVDKYLRQPTMKQKNDFYNGVDIWMAPTSLEGLHIPPAEAMMTGCAVVGTKSEMSGIRDYVIDGVSGILSDDNLTIFGSDVEHLYNHPGCRRRLGSGGIEIIKKIGDRKKNMRLMVELFRSLNENI